MGSSYAKRYAHLIIASGFGLLGTGFAIKVMSYTNALGRTPPYMGPPMGTNALHIVRLLQLPYSLDTFSLVLFGISISLIVIGIVLSIRYRARQVPAEIVSESKDVLYPYH